MMKSYMSIRNFPTDLLLFYKQLADEYQRKAFSIDGTYCYSKERDKEIYKIFKLTVGVVALTLDYIEKTLPNIKDVIVGVPKNEEMPSTDEVMRILVQSLAKEQIKRIERINNLMSELSKIGTYGKEATKKFNDWIAEAMAKCTFEELGEEVLEKLEGLRRIIPLKEPPK